MRLLNCRSLTLGYFWEHELPRYVVLSHRWLDDNAEEISFEDIILSQDIRNPERHRIRRKSGFRKIQQCCKQAVSDEIEWIWVDTCCIKQSSSAELSESINSMFRWYGLAAVCYAYLSDVNVSNLHNSRNAIEFQSSS